MPGALGTTALPFWPALLFSYLEPLSLLLGAYAALSDPQTFITTQLPATTSATTFSPAISPAATILAYTIGSLFLVLAGYAFTCTVLTRDPRVTKYYLLFAACGDVGHLLANYKGMGREVFWAWEEWNAVMWGNIAVTVVLFVNRCGTLAGGLGEVGWKGKGEGKKE